MKTSHEMAQSVLEKRSRILRRRRVLKTSIGAAAGTAAVAAAMLITLNLARPQGVDLIDQSTVSQPGDSDTSNAAGTSTSDSSSSPDVVEPLYPYNDVELRENSETGSLDSYASLVDHLGIYKDNMNFYGFTITKQYTPDEAAELTGEDIFRDSSTLFAAKIYYDYLNKKAADMTILLAQAGNSKSQIAGSPLYGVGEKYIAFFSGFDAESWNVACPELLFAAADDEQCFQINAEQIRFETADGVLLGEDVPENEQYVYTTTSNNPVRYVRRYDIAELSDFLRSDWISHGLYPAAETDAGVLAGYTYLASADIPDIPPEDRGLKAEGVRNVILDTKQAGNISVLLIGDHVTTDNDGHTGMINCFKFGAAVYDGTEVSGFYGLPLDYGQGGSWIYNDRLSDYMSIFQFGDNYIIVLRYYDSDGSCRAVFHAIKDGVLFPQLMGDYSAVTGVAQEVTTWLSENLSIDENACTITDTDSGISYVFDFDAISDTFTQPHYTAVQNSGNDSGSTAAIADENKESLAEQLAEKWLSKWDDISANNPFILPRVSVFSFELRDGSKLAAFVYPNYKTNSAVFYRVSNSGYSEYGEMGCGWQFELLENSSGQYLHITTKYPGSAAYDDRLEVDDEYCLITETALEPVLRVGRYILDGKANDWFVYEGEDITHIPGEEYERLKTSALQYGTVMSTADLDRDGDYTNDEYCSFKDNTEELKAAILSVL